ncbi:MAG: hypothetical protein EPN70_05945 [Paraburkholderia sp.]|uniref:hypothetical protein n=1 Tax=Paraburkholderia sp. TaxID=1926495 RepID=UPI00121E22DA|nr:hypothetical protein [Paraburkholderia sp.]TAM06385.1 MAG: hypothetical protein EPN70_05945 [Paraburkholderia sp.]
MTIRIRRLLEIRAVAYDAGVIAGEAHARKQADQARREIGNALLELGDAIAAGDKARVIACYAKCAEVFAGEAD